MSSYRPVEDRSGPGDTYRPLPAQARGDRNGRMYEEQNSRPHSKDQSRRSTPSPRRYTPPHDRSRTSPHGAARSPNNTAGRREWDVRRERDNAQDHDDYNRGRPMSSRRGEKAGYRDRDREGYRSPRYYSRSRSGSPRRDRSPFYGGPPSREVMLEGIPLEMVEDDISRELKQYHDVEALDDVRVIRDRQTKVSRGFGFLRFATLEKSKEFVERSYPTIYLYGNESADGDEQAAKVRIAFSRERDDRSRAEKSEGEWICKICTCVNFPGRMKCFRCQTPQIDMAALGNAMQTKPSQFFNSGDSDASPDGTPSQFLLIRGLEPTVTEELLGKGVAKMYKPSGGLSPPTAAASRKGGAKVASTTGDANLGAKEGSIRRVLLVRDRRNDESWRYGFAEFATVDDAQAALTRYNSFEKFTISSKPVIASYIHAGVFVPVFDITPGIEKFTFNPLSNTATKLVYWDQEAYVSELVVSAAEPEKSAGMAENQARSASDKAAAAAEKEGLVKVSKETEAKAKKRKADASAAAKQKKTAPAHLQFWSNRHAELHGILAQEQPADSNSDQEQNPNPSTSHDTDTPSIQSFADPQKNCCYLCSRQFKTSAEVNKHERLSDLHRSNLLKDDLKSKALAKMAKAGIPSTSSSAQEAAEYRDRARERRAAFGASKKVSLPLKKDRVDSGPQPDDDADDTPPVVPSKGASLLGKMGWSAGEGLGATGTGRTAPIATDMYVQGVGLGAQGGKVGDAIEEAERMTKGGYGGFLERTREGAKERFERMG